jgi:hypothetical protein
MYGQTTHQGGTLLTGSTKLAGFTADAVSARSTSSP